LLAGEVFLQLPAAPQMAYRCAVAQANPTRIDAAELSRRLLALMDKVSTRAAVEDVHRLRTTVRRLEVRLGAEMPGKIARTLKTLRRKAGKVRDIDVHLGLLEPPLTPPVSARRQTGQATSRSPHAAEPAAQRKLRKILKAQRRRPLASLRKAVAASAPLLAERLPGLVSRQRQPASSAAQARRAVARVRAQYLEAARELAAGQAALHALRIEAKKLRYALEPHSQYPEAAALVAKLKQVQDSIGQWHDWATLEQLAAQTLDSAAAAPLLAALHARCGREYQRARRTARHLRDSMSATAKPAASVHGPQLVPAPMRRAG
jgi:CHAD domain-containing protein